MLVYHGTFTENAVNILKDRKIKCNINRAYSQKHIRTTDGFVYVSQNISRSVKSALGAMGNVNISVNDSDVYIFKCEVSIEEMERDDDEIRSESMWPSMKEKVKLVIDAATSLEHIYSAAVPKDLVLGREVTHYCIVEGLKASSYRNKTNEEIEKKVKWIQI